MTENRMPIGEDEDDVVGHRHLAADAEAIEGEEDTEGHARKARADAEAAEDEDDVVGHVQPPRDLGR
jgi:hypothetical protein